MTQLVNDYKIYMKLKGQFGRDIIFLIVFVNFDLKPEK